MKFEIKGLTVSYGKMDALKNVSLNMEGGRIIGLLGRNGAGKSTLINAMTNKLRPRLGQILLDGQSVWENEAVLKDICCMSEQNLFPSGRKVRALLDETALFYPGFDMARALSLSERFGLDLNKKVSSLSTGYGSITKSIIALCTNTRVMIMDEPVLGLDAAHRELLYKELIRDWERERMIILSTHLIEEVANIIQEAVIIHDGRLLLQSETEDIARMGYSVSGRKVDVVEHTLGLDVISMDEMGTFATAYIRGNAPAELPDGLELGRLSLQKLFVELTENHREVA